MAVKIRSDCQPVTHNKLNRQKSWSIGPEEGGRKSCHSGREEGRSMKQPVKRQKNGLVVTKHTTVKIGVRISNSERTWSYKGTRRRTTWSQARGLKVQLGQRTQKKAGKAVKQLLSSAFKGVKGKRTDGDSPKAIPHEREWKHTEHFGQSTKVFSEKKHSMTSEGGSKEEDRKWDRGKRKRKQKGEGGPEGPID